MSRSNGHLNFSELITDTTKKLTNVSIEPITDDIIEIGPNGKLLTGIKYAQAVEHGTNSTSTSEVLHNYYTINTINNNKITPGRIRLPCEYVDFNKFLKMDTLDCSGHMVSIEQITTFLSQHSEVHKLTLSNCGLEINKLYKLAVSNKALEHITHLDLSSNYFVARPVLRCALDNLVNLKFLNLSNCETSLLGEVRTYGEKLLQMLEEFNISNNDIISLYLLKTLPTWLPKPENMTQLKLLCLSDSNMVNTGSNTQVNLIDVENSLKLFGYNFHLFRHNNDMEREVTTLASTIDDWDLVN